MSALIIDCGSGFTRAAVFQRDSDGRVYSQEAHAAAGLPESFAHPRIVEVLVEGATALRKWVAGIQALVEATGCVTTVLGATGGLRQAEADGKVTPLMLSMLADALREQAPTVEFRRLSGDDEAHAELAAVQHIADLTLPSSVPRPVGMMSSGGMTSQIGWHKTADAPAAFLCVTHALNSASTELREKAEGVDASDARRNALEAFEARVAAEVEATGRRGQLQGTFVVIEMIGAMGSVSEYEGCFAALAQRIGGRLVTKDELTAGLREHLKEWQAQAGPMASRYGAYAGLLPATLLGLTALTDDAATFYVCRAFEVAPGVELKPSWSLGLYATLSCDAARPAQ